MAEVFSSEKARRMDRGAITEAPTQESWFDAERLTCRYLCHRFETLVDIIMHPPSENSKRDGIVTEHITQKQWAAITEGTELLVQFDIDNLLIPSTKIGDSSSAVENTPLCLSEILLVRAIARSIRRINLILLYPHVQQQPLYVVSDKPRNLAGRRKKNK